MREEDHQKRRWIWQAIATLFLDDEIEESDLHWIAYVAAECEYSERELEVIYRKEIAPALAFNAYGIVGIWGYWDTDWLERRIQRRRGLRYWFNRLVIAPVTIWLLRHDWKRIKIMFIEERNRVREEQRQYGDQWKPCWVDEPPCYRWTKM